MEKNSKCYKEEVIGNGLLENGLVSGLTKKV